MAKSVFQVATKAQLQALSAPVRHDILDRLVAHGPMSVRDLAKALGRRPTSVYPHLQQLQRVGLLHPLPLPKGQGERGRPAVLYAPAGPKIRLTEAARKPENAKFMPKIAKAAGKQASRDFVSALRDPRRKDSGPARNHAFYRAVSAPSPERLKEINRLLEELIRLTWSPDPKPGRVISIAWFLSPLDPPRS